MNRKESGWQKLWKKHKTEERMAAIIGPLWWGFIVELIDYKTATLSLALFPIIGWVIYRIHRATVSK